MASSTLFEYIKSKFEGYQERRAFTTLLDLQIQSFLRLEHQQRMQDLYTLQICKDLPPNVRQLVLDKVRQGRSSRAQWEDIVKDLIAQRQRGPVTHRHKRGTVSSARPKSSGLGSSADMCLRRRSPLHDAPWAQQLQQQVGLDLEALA